MKKFLIPGTLLLILLSLQATKYGLQYAVPDILPPTGPITMVVVIYESEVDDALAYPKEHETMMGKMSQELRKANKWRQYDKDHVPMKWNILAVEAKVGQSGEKWQPWFGLYHDTKLTENGPSPKSDGELKKLIEENGGL